MSSNAKNVSLVSDNSGNSWAYVSRDGHIWVGVAQCGPDAPTLSTYDIQPPQKHKPKATFAVAALSLVTSNSELPGSRLVFYQIEGSNSIWVLVDQHPASPSELDAEVPTPSLLPSTELTVNGKSLQWEGGFDAVATAKGFVLVGVPVTSNEQVSVDVVSVAWDDVNVDQQSLTISKAIQCSLLLPNSQGSLGDAVELAATAFYGPDATDAMQQYVMFQITQAYGSETVLFLYRFGLSSTLEVVEDTLSVDPVAQYTVSKNGAWPKCYRRPDGKLYLHFVDATGTLHQNAAEVVDYVAYKGSTGSTYWFADSSFSLLWEQISQPRAAAIAYVPGESKATPSTANPSLIDVQQPLFPIVCYWTAKGLALTQLSANAWGSLNRTGTAAVQVSDKVQLLGIIEGAPPIPSQNLSLPGSNSASVKLTQTESHSTSFTISWEASIYLKVQVSAGFKVQASVEGMSAGGGADIFAGMGISANYSGLHQKQTVVTESTLVEVDAKIGGTPPTVQPYGNCLCYTSKYASYVYSFQYGDGGETPDGQVALIQVFPQDSLFTMRQYLINPQSGPTPGDLKSYFPAPNQKDDYDEDSILDSGSSSYLEVSWNCAGGTATTSYTKAKTTQLQNTLKFSFKEDMGIKVWAELGAVKAGVAMDGGYSLGLGFQWGDSTTKTLSVGVSQAVAGNCEAPGSCTNYTSLIYMLKSDKQWAAELKQSLQPELFSDGSQKPEALAEITSLLDSVLWEEARPWRICYLVDPTSVQFNAT